MKEGTEIINTHIISPTSSQVVATPSRAGHRLSCSPPPHPICCLSALSLLRTARRPPRSISLALPLSRLPNQHFFPLFPSLHQLPAHFTSTDRPVRSPVWMVDSSQFPPLSEVSPSSTAAHKGRKDKLVFICTFKLCITVNLTGQMNGPDEEPERYRS